MVPSWVLEGFIDIDECGFVKHHGVFGQHGRHRRGIPDISLHEGKVGLCLEGRDSVVTTSFQVIKTNNLDTRLKKCVREVTPNEARDTRDHSLRKRHTNRSN
jgi:hypothetical protein